MYEITVKTFSAPIIRKNEILRFAKVKHPTEDILSLLDEVIGLCENELEYKVCFAVLPLKMSGGISSGGLGCLMNAAGGFAAGFAPMIVGSIIETSGWQISYVIVFIITIALFIALLATMFLLNKNKKKA